MIVIKFLAGWFLVSIIFAACYSVFATIRDVFLDRN